MFDNPLDKTKKSKAGRLILHKDGYDTYHTMKLDDSQDLKDELVTVYEDGELKVEYNLKDIRAKTMA